jgi:hypothetical protein
MLCECGCGQRSPLATVTRRAAGRQQGQPTRFVKGHNGRGRIGDKHQSWMGAEATYNAVHRWLQNHRERTGICEHCGSQPDPYRRMTTGTDFANVSGRYLRSADDYVELCRSCHITFDNRRRDTK